MSVGRLRPRRDRFELRGWTYWVSLADHGKLAALVADTDDVQHVKLMTELTVEVRPGDVPLIFEQLGWPIPGKRRTVEAAPVVEVAAEPEPKQEAKPEAVESEQPAPGEALPEPAPPPEPIIQIVDNPEHLARISELEEKLSAALSKPPVEVERVVERVVEVAAPAPVVEAALPDPTVIPDELVQFSNADESAEEFRARIRERLEELLTREFDTTGSAEAKYGPMNFQDKIDVHALSVANALAKNWLGLKTG